MSSSPLDNNMLDNFSNQLVEARNACSLRDTMLYCCINDDKVARCACRHRSNPLGCDQVIADIDFYRRQYTDIVVGEHWFNTACNHVSESKATKPWSYRNGNPGKKPCPVEKSTHVIDVVGSMVKHSQSLDWVMFRWFILAILVLYVVPHFVPFAMAEVIDVREYEDEVMVEDASYAGLFTSVSNLLVSDVAALGQNAADVVHGTVSGTADTVKGTVNSVFGSVKAAVGAAGQVGIGIGKGLAGVAQGVSDVIGSDEFEFGWKESHTIAGKLNLGWIGRYELGMHYSAAGGDETSVDVTADKSNRASLEPSRREDAGETTAKPRELKLTE